MIWFRRDNPASVLGRTYDTLMPRYWQTTTFIWDYSLSSLTHALLDPEPMRKHIEHWVDLDTHKHFGTEWLTGGPVGYWYSVNDFAMTRLVRDYVRFTGDAGVPGRSGGRRSRWPSTCTTGRPPGVGCVVSMRWRTTAASTTCWSA